MAPRVPPCLRPLPACTAACTAACTIARNPAPRRLSCRRCAVDALKLFPELTHAQVLALPGEDGDLLPVSWAGHTFGRLRRALRSGFVVEAWINSNETKAASLANALIKDVFSAVAAAAGSAPAAQPVMRSRPHSHTHATHKRTHARTHARTRATQRTPRTHAEPTAPTVTSALPLSLLSPPTLAGRQAHQNAAADQQAHPVKHEEQAAVALAIMEKFPKASAPAERKAALVKLSRKAASSRAGWRDGGTAGGL